MNGSGILRLIVGLVILGLIVGVLVWFVPLPYPFRELIIAVAVIGAVLWLAKEAGFWSGGP